MKKLNKKGFTLIELLAVIVILAIIIVIAVPSVLNLQANAKKGTTKDESLLLIKSVELCLASEQSLSKCSATNALAATAPDAGSNTTTNISKYYDKTIDGTNITYTLAGNVDAPTLAAFKFVSNGYTVEAVATVVDDPDTTDVDETAPVAAKGQIATGLSLSAAKTAIEATYK